jgi:hypothetical protein
MEKTESLLSIYSLVILLTALAVPNAVNSQSLKGACSGTVTQNEPEPHSYGVSMKLEGDSGSISYPSLDCGGPVTFIRKKGATYLYREHIIYGSDICIDGGIIQIKLRKNSILWYWSGSGVTANGTLTGKLSRQRKHTCNERKRI